MLKIAVITAYYGKFPDYFNAWLRSAQANSDIDYYLVTDSDIGFLPSNVKKIPLSFDDFRLLIEEKLGRSVKLEKPYKICDYRPMYGIIFDDYLKGYDYWAYADTDVVFGNIRKLLENNNIENYDKFNFLGHLSFYRNTEKNNSAFKLDGAVCGSWEDVVSTNLNCLFDEWNGIYGIYKHHNLPMFEEKIFADIAISRRRFSLSLNCPNYDKQVFYWQDGGVFRTYIENGELKEEEFIYIHFKKRPFKKENFDIFSADAFYICPDGIIYKENKNTTEKDIDRYNPYPGKLTELFQYIIFRIRKFKRLFKKKLVTVYTRKFKEKGRT